MPYVYIYPKYLDSLTPYRSCPNPSLAEHYLLTCSVLANSVDPDQLASEEAY